MKYITTVNDQEYIIDIDQDNQITVNGEVYAIDFQSLPESGLVSLIINNHSYEGVVEDRDESLWGVLVKGELYEVTVQDERAYRLAQARGSFAAQVGEALVKSPMPGIIVNVPVAVGDIVAKGDTVIILESMKMENELKSPMDGEVTAVTTAAGDSVEKNQLLITVRTPDEE